jgi:hypothetical protein
MPKGKRGETPWVLAARFALAHFIQTLATIDRDRLRKAGLYREKIAGYLKNGHVPHSENVLALLIICETRLRVLDPETGKTWVLRFEEEQTQLSLALDGAQDGIAEPPLRS